MAHVTSIKVDGLLGRSDQIRFDLQRDVNVFFGENGCGKTTLLKVIDAALSRDADAIQRLPVSRAEIDIYSINHDRVIKHVWERKKTKASITVSTRQFISDSNELSSDEQTFFVHDHVDANAWRLTPTSKAYAAAKRWSHTFLPTTRLYLSDRASRVSPGRPQLSESQLDEVFAESVNRAWLVYYSNTLQEVRRIQEVGLRAVLVNVISTKSMKKSVPLHDPAGVYERVEKFLARQPESTPVKLGNLETFSKRYVEDENLRRVVDNLYEIELHIEKAMQPVERFKSTIESLFSKGKKISLQTNQLEVELLTGEKISAANLSSGEKHLLKILLSTMTAASNSVLIDEPELSMHIDWQRVFVRTVHALNNSCQLILASHSPEIMADLSDEKIFKI